MLKRYTGDTIQGIESSIASFQSLIANFPRDGIVTAEIADLYTQYYETAESIIVLMLKCHEIHIDPTYRVKHPSARSKIPRSSSKKAQVPRKHAFHEAVLQSLAALENPLHGMLGHGSVHRFLRDVKDFRNKWTQRRRENDTSNKLLHSMPAMNLFTLQMRELNGALESALTCTKREVERRSLERPIEAARLRELQERELRSRKEAENQRQIETMKAEQEKLIMEIENQHHIEAKEAGQAKLITELEKKVKALEERESRSIQEPYRQTETRNAEQAKLISELGTKVKALEDEKFARRVELLSCENHEHEKVIIDMVKVQESQATRIESLHNENAELAWKVRTSQEDNCVRTAKISSVGFTAWYDQLYMRWSKSLMDALENRNLPGARATLDEAYELSKDSIGPHSTHLGIALKLLENVLALGEAKKKTAVEKLQMALEWLKD